MNGTLIFTIGLGFVAAAALTAGIFFLKMNEKNLPIWEKVPRNRIAGGILGLAALLCFIPNVEPVFPPEQNLYWLIPAAVILAILCYLYLDHLLARALAGGLVLLTHFLLAESFNADLKGRSLFALFCFAAGTFAILIAAKPYWLRDCFRKMCNVKKWRIAGGVFCILWAGTALILLIQQIGKAV